MRWMRSRWTITSTVVNFAHETATRRGEAHRRHGNGCRLPCGSVGWVGGVYPSAPLKARTAASDGQRVFTRAARSAGLRFAVILLSKAMDIGRDHLIHRKRSPFPYEGKALTRSKFGVTFPAGSGTSKIRGERSVAAARRRAGWRWRGSPLRIFKGADSGFRRTLCNHPRRAQRRAQVCGEITVKSNPH